MNGTRLILELFGELVFSVFGIYFIKESKRRANLPWLLLGLALVAFPYFVSNLLLEWGIGIALLVGAYWLRNG